VRSPTLSHRVSEAEAFNPTIIEVEWRRELKLECLRNTRLIEYSVGRVARLDLLVHGHFALRDRAEPKVVVTLGVAIKSASVVCQNAANIRSKIGHLVSGRPGNVLMHDPERDVRQTITGRNLAILD